MVTIDPRKLDVPLCFLRNVLYQSQSKGLVIDGRRIVDLETISRELSKSNFQPSIVNVDLPNSAMVNEDQFFPLLYADISNAKESIIVYSGFFTPKRVAEILPLLEKVMSKGVVVRFVIPSNDTNGSFGKKQPEDCERTVKAIRQRGISVDQRYGIHQKAQNFASVNLNRYRIKLIASYSSRLSLSTGG